MNTFSLNINSEKHKIDRYWERVVGSCHAATALRADWREQLERAHRELGFEYVRFHGIFNDDMSVVKKNLLGTEYILSFTNIDNIFDFLLSIGMKPFIELGFMPEALASGDQTIFHYKGNITKPQDPERWAWLIDSFVRHLIERYGRGEVRQWFFEVWNEPNLGGEDLPGGSFWAGSMEDYFQLYKITAQAIKAVDSTLRVGGPATSNNAYVTETVEFCRKNNVPIDFISTHHYPTDVVLGYGVENSQNFIARLMETDPNDFEAVKKLSEDYSVFKKTLWEKVDRGVLTQMAKRAVEEAQGLPVYYTEWSSLSGIASDGAFGASFIAKTLMDNMGLVEAYAYWTFSDIFEESGMPSHAFHGGFGLLTLQGVPKAPYRVYQLLHKLGGEMFTASYNEGTVDIFAFYKTESRAVQLLAVNHHSLLHPIESEEITLRLEGVNTSHADILRVDDDHANALAAWEAMGSPEYLDEGQKFALMAASALKREDLTLSAKDGATELKLTLPPMGTALITVYLN